MSISISNNSVKYKDTSNSWIGLNNVLDGVKELPTVTIDDNGKVLQVVSGNWEIGASLNNYLPLSGGTLTGNISVTHSDATESRVNVKNSLREGRLVVSETGNLGIYDITNSKWIVCSDSNNTVTLNGTANSANILNIDTRMTYGWNGVNYFNISGTAGNAAATNDTPTTNWWHIMRFNHANSSGYYTDLAIPFNATSLYYKRIVGGAVQNSGWVKVLDALNYTSYCATASHTHSYLPLSGGSLTGAVKSSSSITASGGFKAGSTSYSSTSIELYGTTPFIDFHYGSSTADYTHRIIANSSYFNFIANGFGIRMGVGITDSSMKSICPCTIGGAAYDAVVYCGASTSRWDRVYAKNGVNTSSDEREKDIFELDDRYKNLFMKTNAILYRWKDGDTTTFHIGVGAQSFEKSAYECGLTTSEVGAIIHDFWDEPNSDGRTDRYSINYDEIAMLTIPFVQKHEKKIQTLEEENSTLKTELAELKELVQQLIA